MSVMKQQRQCAEIDRLLESNFPLPVCCDEVHSHTLRDVNSSFPLPLHSRMNHSVSETVVQFAGYIN